MAKRNEFIELVLELLAPLGTASARAMFGGHGVYLDGVIIAIVVDDTLYFKTDEQNRVEFDRLGLEPFTYEAADGKQQSMSYVRAPDEALDSPHAMRPWARSAMAAALRKKSVRTAAKPKAERVPKPKSLKARAPAAKIAQSKTRLNPGGKKSRKR
jgi:DNA transformation protein